MLLEEMIYQRHKIPFLEYTLIAFLNVLVPILNRVGANDVALASEDVRKKFEDAKIVPELIPVAPKYALEVLYKNNTVKFGNEFHRGDFETAPTNLQWPTEKGQYYTLIFTDPDCSNSDRPVPIDKEWHHWLVVNIPGCEVYKGEVLSAYFGGLPFYLQYPHRYVFLAYIQPDAAPIVFDEPRLDDMPIEDRRYNFSTRNFTKKYDLGNPIAGNFFVAGGPAPTPELPLVLQRMLTTTKKRPRFNATTRRTPKK
nr:PREDICTED: protein D1-like [Bemisia tabaci]